TERDQRRIAMLGRWYTLNATHLIRAEHPPHIWWPLHPEYNNTENRNAAQRAFHTIQHRLNKLRRIEHEPSRNLGPVVGADMSTDGRTAWYATRIGGTVATLPWTMRNRINPLLAQHAWMAADIGMALEESGYTVLSERELSTATTQHGLLLDTPFESDYISPNAPRVAKRPDLAVPNDDSSRYIAIEAERDTDRSIKTYEHKLRAYRRNTAVHAVWYICASQATANRVAQGASRALGSNSTLTLRIRVQPP